MGLKDMLEKAIKVSAEIKFNVVILEQCTDYSVEKEMNYLELGTYLVSNGHNIASVVINLRD